MKIEFLQVVTPFGNKTVARSSIALLEKSITGTNVVVVCVIRHPLRNRAPMLSPRYRDMGDRTLFQAVRVILEMFGHRCHGRSAGLSLP